MKTFLFLAGFMLLINGCSYAVSRDLVAQSDKSITLQQIQADPARLAGTTVILGGEIIAIRVAKQGTLIEVLERPLDLWGKPKRTVQSGGRFLLLHSRALDTIVFTPGREITAAAQVKGTFEKGLTGEEIEHPLLVTRELKLWEQERSADRPAWWDPLHDPHAQPRRE